MNIETDIEKLKELINKASQKSGESVVSAKDAIATSIEIGKHLITLRSELGGSYQEFIEQHVPEATQFEYGSTRLAKIHERQPELFGDPDKFIRFAKLAGCLPITSKRKSVNQDSPAVKAYKAISKATNALIALGELSDYEVRQIHHAARLFALQARAKVPGWDAP